MSSLGYFLDPQSRKEMGYALWQLRREKCLRVSQVAKRTGIAERYIDKAELGYGIKFSVMRRLLQFYGKNVKIVFE